MNDVTRLAELAATHWGGLAGVPRLVRNRENVVFEAALKSGQRAALRLHRVGYQSRDNIESELLWTEALAEEGFPCPRPLRTKDGGLSTTLPQGPAVSLVTWIDAKPIGENGVEFDGQLKDQCKLYEDVGSLIRKLHHMTDGIDTSNIERPSWNAKALLGDDPHWGRFWDNPALTDAEQELIGEARRNAAQQFKDINSLDEGLIHADLLQENILSNDDGLHIIDFDDSGRGYRFYDLGTALIQHAEHPNLDDLSSALCTGYGCDPKLMPLFIMLRSMASCGWVMSRSKSDDPVMRFYANRAVTCAQRYLSG